MSIINGTVVLKNVVEAQKLIEENYGDITQFTEQMTEVLQVDCWFDSSKNAITLDGDREECDFKEAFQEFFNDLIPFIESCNVHL